MSVRVEIFAVVVTGLLMSHASMAECVTHAATMVLICDLTWGLR